MLALSRRGGEKDILVRIAREYEKYIGRSFDGHMCVTKAMAQWLVDNWEIRAVVLHDKPPSFFHQVS